MTSVAPAGGAAVSLSSSSGSVSAPPTVTIPAGAWYVFFTVPTGAVSSRANAVVNASYAGSSLNTPITLDPPLPFLQSISFSPSTVAGGFSTTGTVTLTTAVPQSPSGDPAVISLASTGSYLQASIPSQVSVPVGAESATFNVPTSTTNFISPITVTGSYNGTSKSAELIVTPPGTPLAPALLMLSPYSVIGGSGASGVIQLTGPVPSAGATLTISTDSSTVQTPLTAEVPAGATSVTIAITTQPVSAISTATITVVMNGVSQSALLTIMPSSGPKPGNPMPFLAAPLAPVSVVPSGAGIPVTVNGSGFVSGAQILWNGLALPTTFNNQFQLQASIPSSDSGTNGTGLIAVRNPDSPTRTSNALPMHLTYPTAAPTFNKSALSVSGQAAGASSGDFNGDGIPDIVVGKTDGSGLSVFLGNGDGTFGIEELLTGLRLFSTAVGDLNGDGKPDVAALTYDGSTVLTFLGNGDGTFTDGISTPVASPANAPSAVLGDFNRDGTLDLVVTTAKGVSVFLGNGDGTFGPPSSFALANPAAKLAIADFDGDGVLDIAATDQLNQSIAILRGKGDGRFSGPLEYGTNGFSVDLVVADFNGDGHPDIAVANNGPVGSNGSGIAILRNNGNGAFSPPTTVTPGQDYYHVSTEDINGDGKLDLVVSAATPSLQNEIFLGNGDGTFYTQPVGLGTAVNSPATIADFNGDGAPDILLASSNGPATILIQAMAPIVSVAPGSLSFTAQQGAAVSDPVSFTISNTGAAAANWSASPSQSWLQISQSSGSLPSTVYATANTAGLSAGTCAGVITVTITGASNAPFAIPVSLSVQPTAVVISSFAFTPSTLIGGGTAVGTITLSGPAPAGGYTVSISSSSALVQVPSSVMIGAGQTSGTFSASVSTVTVSTDVSLTVAYGETSASATLTLTPALFVAQQFVPVSPCRVVDTRAASGPFGGPELTGSSTRNFEIPSGPCKIPSNATAYSLNVTVVPDKGLGYLSIWPSGQTQPVVSTLNSDGRVKANAAIVPAGANGGVAVYVSDASHVILDINGYFVAGDSTALDFYPVIPCRIADTRAGNSPLGGPYLTGGLARAFPVLSSSCNIPATAQAYSLNFTAVPHEDLGFLSTWPTGQPQPLVSTLNASTAAVTANAAIVPSGTGGAVNVYASNDSDVIIDVNGYFAPPATGGLSLYNVTPCRALDTRSGNGASFQGTINSNVSTTSCQVPATAQAFVLNATVVPSPSPDGLRYLTLWPTGDSQPFVSTLNASDGAVTSNMAIVPAINGSVSAYATDPTQLILDISGYFDTSAPLSPSTSESTRYEGYRTESRLSSYSNRGSVAVVDIKASDESLHLFLVDGIVPDFLNVRAAPAMESPESWDLKQAPF